MNDFRKLSDDQLDDLFRSADAATAIESQFDNAFWSEMEAMMPVVGRRRRAVFVWWGAAAIFLGFSMMWYWNFQQWSPNLHYYNWEKGTCTLTQVKAKPIDICHAVLPTEPINSIKKSAKRKHINVISAPIYRFRASETKVTIDSFLIDNPLTLFAENQPDQPVEMDTKLPFKPIEMRSSKRIIAPLATMESRFYYQLSMGLGQSYQELNTQNGKLGYQLAAGAGVHKAINQMEMSFGLNVRMESQPGLEFSEFGPYTTVSGTTVTAQKKTTIHQLFSLELPVSLGTRWKNHLFYGQLAPGFQQFYTGDQRFVVNAVESSREKSSGKLSHVKTLTMEVGLGYSYTIRRNILLGAQFNMDVIRPFDANYYLGNQRSFPMNMQVTLRRYF